MGKDRHLVFGFLCLVVIIGILSYTGYGMYLSYKEYKAAKENLKESCIKLIDSLNNIPPNITLTESDKIILLNAGRGVSKCENLFGKELRR